MPLDTVHDEEDDHHRRDGIAGTLDELGGQDDQQHRARHQSTDAVDDTAAHHPSAHLRVALGAQVAVPVPDHAALAPVSYTHLRAHETRHDLVCRLLLEKK